MKFLFSLFLIPTLFISCATPTQKIQAVNTKLNDKLSQSVFAVNDSIHAGRFDLAEDYSDQSIKLIVPPQKRIVIKQILK